MFFATHGEKFDLAEAMAKELDRLRGVLVMEAVLKRMDSLTEIHMQMEAWFPSPAYTESERQQMLRSCRLFNENYPEEP